MIRYAAYATMLITLRRHDAAAAAHARYLMATRLLPPRWSALLLMLLR